MMNQYQVEASAVIDAPAAHVHAIVADYNDRHQAILPKPYFVSMEVLAGGVGAGTELKLTMKVMGQDFVFHQEISEPEPGRVLVEADNDAGVVTTFTFEPLNDDTQTQVTISTVGKTSSGIKGWLEKMTTPMIMGKIYRAELENLAQVAQQCVASPRYGFY